MRYDRYDLKVAADRKRYVTPAKNAKPDMNNPMNEMHGMVLDFLNEGIQMMFSFMLMDDASTAKKCL